MKVLVTGGAGYVGSVTVKLLLDAGHDVSVFDNLERGHKAALDDRAGFTAGDLRIASEIEKAMAHESPDAVIHFAAYALVGESMAYPERYFTNNVNGAVNLAEAMRKADVRRLIFSSTCATYGEPQEMPITELTPQSPTNPYGASKLMCENIFRWYSLRHQWQTVFLRYFNACGANGRLGEDHTPETHLIPNIMRVALGQNSHLEVFGNDYPTPDGTCIRDYIHVSDLGLAHLSALVKPQKESCCAFNLGSDTGRSVLEILEAARKITGHSIPALYKPRRTGDPPCLLADSTKARLFLEWKPKQSEINQIVETAWQWHKTHPGGYAK